MEQQTDDPLGSYLEELALKIVLHYGEFRKRWDSQGQTMEFSLQRDAGSVFRLLLRRRGDSQNETPLSLGLLMTALRARLPEYIFTFDAPTGAGIIQVIHRKDVPDPAAKQRAQALTSPILA